MGFDLFGSNPLPLTSLEPAGKGMPAKRYCDEIASMPFEKSLQWASLMW